MSNKATEILYEWFVDDVSQGAASADNTKFDYTASSEEKTEVVKCRAWVSGYESGAIETTCSLTTEIPTVLPTNAAIEVTPQELIVGEAVDFNYSCVVEPEGADVIGYSWLYNKVGETEQLLPLFTGASGTANLPSVVLPAGDYEISCRVSYDGGSITSDPTPISIVDRVASDYTITDPVDGASIQSGSDFSVTVTVAAEATVPIDGMPKVIIDGVETNIPSDPPSFVDNGDGTLTITCNDGWQGFNKGLIPFWVDLTIDGGNQSTDTINLNLTNI